MAEGIPRYAWDSSKGALPWTWPPMAHAAGQGGAAGARVPNGAQPRVAPRARRHFGGHAPPGGGTAPARLPGDTRSSYGLAGGLYLLAARAALPVLALLVVLYLKRRR